jgi:tetratricopeptide (TPR) repeat protein
MALLREPRRALHARIAETLESHFGEIAENQPQLLARHYTDAGLIEKAAGLWGKAGQRSLERSALVEAAAQLTHALDQIETLATPALRREQINLQVTLVSALGNLKGYAAPETKAALEQARLLIEHAETLGEPPPHLFSVLIYFWAASLFAFNGDVLRELAAQFLAFAEKQGATRPLMIGHRLMGTTLAYSGNVLEAPAHYDRALSLYDPVEHRALATRFGQDLRVVILCNRAGTLWRLGYPTAALADAERALKYAREIGQASTLMYGMTPAVTHALCGNYAAAKSLGGAVSRRRESVMLYER